MIRYYDPYGGEISLREWSDMFEKRHKGDSSWWRVGETKITDDVKVSTVWIGLDHRFGTDGPPLIFESMVFGGPMDGEMRRYSSWSEAQEGHEELVALVELDLHVSDHPV